MVTRRVGLSSARTNKFGISLLDYGMNIGAVCRGLRVHPKNAPVCPITIAQLQRKGSRRFAR
jgi:hypothetical protein